VGHAALLANTTGNYNTAVGFYSLFSNTTPSSNGAFGFKALVSNTTGVNNNAFGDSALRAMTTGTMNSAFGNNAGTALTTAGTSVAVGFDALKRGTTSDNTTAVGKNAGAYITTANNNTCLGMNAGAYITNLTTGAQNTILGSYAHTSAADAMYANVIGHNVSGAAGYTTLGVVASDIRALHGNVTWATVSDQRYKKDIVDATAGLSFINALQPRTFKYKTLGELPETFDAYKADSTEAFKNSVTNHGFIAQEVKAAIDADDSLKDGFRLWDDRDDGSQEVAEAALIPVLVKAIQELTARLETLEG
jgi:hypothetical protein